MATAILIMFNTPERGHSNGVFKKQQFLHSQKLHTVVGQKYHPEWYFLTRPARTDTSSFFGIGILPISDLLGGQYFWSVLLIWRELLFSAKGGLAVSKRGPKPPFFSKRGPMPPFWGKKGFPPKKWYRNVPTDISFSIGMVNTKKSWPIPTEKYRFVIQL